MLVECPSGLKGNIRGLKLKEFADLSDAKLLRTGRLFTKLVSSCWLSTVALGPYQGMSDTLPWDNMLQGDLFKVFMSIRCATFGNEYAFERTCKQTLCGSRFEYVIDLDKMPVKKLPESSLHKVRTGGAFTTTVAGRKVTYKLLTSSDTQTQQRLMNDSNVSMAVAAIMTRIVEVEGIEQHDPEALQAWLEDLEMNEGIELRETMEAADCGLDTGVLVVCPKCGDEDACELPLGPSFFRKHKKISTASKTTGTAGSAA